MNKVILSGRTTKDVELTTTSGAVSVARTTLAVQRKFKNAEGEYESDFINLVAWRNTAEFMNKYVKKGNRIAVEGSIQTRSYDAQDGTKRYVTEVVVNEVELLESKGTVKKEEPEITKIDDDSLPF